MTATVTVEVQKKPERKFVQRIASNEDMSKFVAALLMDEPFFGHILLHINSVLEEKIDTAGVAVKDGDVFLFWNKDFLSSLTSPQVRGLLKHECFHLVFQHCTKRMLTPHEVANLAADLAINSAIPKEELPEGGWIPGEIHIDPRNSEKDDSPLSKLVAKFPKHKSMEWYFAELMKSDEVQELIKSGAIGEAGAGFDEHDNWGDLTPEEQELVKGKVQQVLKEAVAKADKSNRWGTVGSEMREQLRVLISNEVDWRAVLRQFVKGSRRGKTTTTWTTLHMSNLEEHHGPAAPGKRRGYESNIDVYIDQSGSMSDQDLMLAFGELANFTRRTEFTTFHFDTDVDLRSELKWKGRGIPSKAGLRTRCGGTDFTEATKHANKVERKVDGMLIITDGGASKPLKSRIRRGWILVPGTELAFAPEPEDFIIKMKKPSM